MSTGRIAPDGESAPSAAADFALAMEESAPPAEPSGGVNGADSGPIASAGQSPVQQGTQRLIIKDGQMTIEVRQTDAAADQLMLITIDFGGYVIGQRIWTGDGGFRFANIQVAVPVNQFEAALRAFRTLGVVLDESASGQDVTDEFVDLNSRLGNLHATQMRLRTFLEQANTISETLRVHEELTQIEEEISLVQGRINYLQDRAAFSTITVNLQPLIPTPTPTPSPTPTPIPTAQSWRPGDTAKTALVQLQESGQSFFDFILYNGIVCGPWLVAFAGLGYLGYRGVQRARRRSG
ncbi:MAG: DUF4349 domain-containing protein [Anaerolineae bacterium]|nr:DUF4349 domain-containing protein [Anaerolineae bacterium]